MKGIKMCISLAAVMLVAGSMAHAQTRPVYKTGTATMPAGETNLYINVEGLKVVGDDLLTTYLKLDEVAFKNVSGTATGTVRFTPSILLIPRRPLWKIGNLPSRAWDWAKLRVSYRALQAGSWPVWVAASRCGERVG